eukprot:7945235-Heterocapsa_arctica.AAC.1
MKVRRVIDPFESNGVAMTIRPWADNLNAGRCLNCCERDHRTICPRGARCDICNDPLQIAQDNLM